MSSPEDNLPNTSIPHQPLRSNKSTLVEHLIAAKRALSSTSQVHRANELISQAKANIEQIAVRTARVEFTRNAIQKQLRIASDAHKALTKVKWRVDAEFKQVIARLDTADEAVNGALNQLRGTHVHASLQLKPSDGASNDEASKNQEQYRKMLYDFVDIEQLESIRAYFRQCIDAVGASDRQFSDVLATLHDRTNAVAEAMDPQHSPAFIKLSNAGIAQTFSMLEDIASDMAESLQSLVKHYDLCVTAVRNTEGAGAAVAAKLDESDRGLEQQEDEPQISEEERIELLQVIQNDAEEVEDVVSEISRHAAEMETQAEQIDEHLKALVAESSNVADAAKALDTLGTSLSSCSQAGTAFVSSWNEQLANIQEKLPEMDAADHAFRGYLDGYKRMTSELKRRKKFKANVARLYEEEADERQTFLEEWGHSLPVDFLPLLHGDPRDSIRGPAD